MGPREGPELLLVGLVLPVLIASQVVEAEAAAVEVDAPSAEGAEVPATG